MISSHITVASLEGVQEHRKVMAPLPEAQRTEEHVLYQQSLLWQHNNFISFLGCILSADTAPAVYVST